MKNILIIIILLTTSLNLFANSCLENATNDELLNEIHYRLGSGNPDQEKNIIVTFTCDNNRRIDAVSTNIITGASSKDLTLMASWDKCEEIATYLNLKMGNRTIEGGVLFAICTNNRKVKKQFLTKSGELTILTSTLSPNWDACYRTANTINESIVTN